MSATTGDAALPVTSTPSVASIGTASKQAKQRLTSRTASAAAFVIATLWTIPTFGLLATSFRPKSEIDDNGWWNVFTHPTFTLDNYREALSSSGGLGSNFINTTMGVFVVISLMLLTGVIDFADIVAEKAAWEVFFYFTSLLTLSSGLNEIGFIKWVAEGYAKPLSGLSPTMALVLLVTFFFWVHYFFSSITAHTAAILPVVLAVGKSIPGMPMDVLTLLCIYSLGLMGVISPYATGPAPMYYGSGYIGKGEFWKFGLIFGLMFFAGLLLIVLPWLEVIGNKL